jgi:hypothetical protein
MKTPLIRYFPLINNPINKERKMIKSKLIMALLLAVSIMFFASPVLAENGYKIQYVAQFSQDELSFDKLMGYDMVTLKDGDFLTELGKPMLPSKELKIALPAGMAAKSVQVVNTTEVEIPGEFSIFPAQPPLKIGISDENVDFVEPDKEIYSSTQPYPSKLVEFAYQTDLAGQGMAVIKVYPLQYVPSEKRLKLYTSITLVIEGVGGYECGDYLSPNISDRGRKNYEQMVKGMVVNPEDVRLNTALKGGSLIALPPGAFDHVIITLSTWVSYFQPLADWHTQKGVRDTIVTTSWIYANYGSVDTSGVRSFIIDANSTWGTDYFLLAGEGEIVPFCYRTYYPSEPHTPSDQYYSDFDDDWTNEVYVGRATVGNSTEVTRFVNKVLKYEKDPPRTDYPLDVLLIGMDLDASTHSQFMKETIDGYIPSRFNVHKVYDSHGGNHRDSVMYYLNQGQNLVNHMDHSNIDVMGTGDFNHTWAINSGNVDALTNDNKMSIVVTLGCLPNHMDSTDCIGEHFVIYNPNQAGVAFTGATRDELYNAGNYNTLAHALDKQWWAALFTRNKYHLGQTLVDAKHNFTDTSPGGYHCEWELNLLGEPEMPVWTDEPDSFATTFPSAILIGSSSFLVHVEDSTTHTPIDQAFICLWKRNEVYLTGTTNANGDKTFDLSPSTQGIMYVTVTKRDYLPCQDSASVVSLVVRTDPATEVEESTATIHGYLDNDGGFEATCWLMWDTDSGEPYANSESLGVLPNGSEFSKELTGLTERTIYYFNAKAHNIAGWASDGESAFLTKPLTPTELTAQGIAWNKISLSWTKPLSADRIVIERDTLTTWARGGGIEVYNDTGTTCQDSGLLPLSHYYYQAWSYCSEGELFQYSDEYATADATTLSFKRGDANADGVIEIRDVVYLINYLFLVPPGPAPQPWAAGDVNCDGTINVTDVVYLINYLFLVPPGPPPGCP